MNELRLRRPILKRAAVCTVLGGLLGGMLTYRAIEASRTTIQLDDVINDVVFARDGDELFIASRGGATAFAGRESPFVQRWSQKHIVFRLGSMAVNSAGDRLAIGAFESRSEVTANVVILDTRTGDVVHELLAHDGVVCKVAFTPDGKYLITSGAPYDADYGTAGEVRLWRTDTWEIVAERLGLGGPVEAVDVDPMGRYLLMADGTRLSRWDPLTLAEQQAWVVSELGIRDLAICSDATRAACVGPYGIKVYRFPEGTSTTDVRDVDWCWCVKWIPGSSTALVCGGESGAFYVDLAREKVTRIASEPRRVTVDGSGSFAAIVRGRDVQLFSLNKVRN